MDVNDVEAWGMEMREGTAVVVLHRKELSLVEVEALAADDQPDVCMDVGRSPQGAPRRSRLAGSDRQRLALFAVDAERQEDGEYHGGHRRQREHRQREPGGKQPAAGVLRRRNCGRNWGWPVGLRFWHEGPRARVVRIETTRCVVIREWASGR